MPELTVAASFARGLLKLAMPEGGSETALAEHFRFDHVESQDPDNRIPMLKYVRARAFKRRSGRGRNG